MARIAYIIPIVLAVASGAAAQDPDPRLKPSLKPAEVKRLNTLAKKWIAAELRWDEEPRHRKTRDRERAKFMAELEKKSRKTDALASVGNLLSMFDQVFPYKKNKTFGIIKEFKDPRHFLLGPKAYDSKKKFASVLVLPSWNEKKSAWTTAKAHVEATWKSSALTKSTFVVLPELRKGDDYNKVPEQTPKGHIDEKERIRGVLGAFGAVQRNFRLDRQKMFIDCGDGTSGFGLRLLSYFPSRFAGAILRAPTDHGKLALDSLAGLPLLLISTENTKATCDKIKSTLDALHTESQVSIVGYDADPAKMAAAVDEWMKGKVKRLYPSKVLLSPTHDAFHKAYWVEIIACEPIDSIGPKEKLFLNVSSDREKNRVTISSEGVSEIGLYLNDYLLDLDKEVTFVVNGKEIKGTKFQRSIRTIERYMRRAYDPTALYTAYHRIEIPKPEQKAEEGRKGEGK
jgi:hypothetical protein